MVGYLDWRNAWDPRDVRNKQKKTFQPDKPLGYDRMRWIFLLRWAVFGLLNLQTTEASFPGGPSVVQLITHVAPHR